MKRWILWLLFQILFFTIGGLTYAKAEDLPREEEPIIKPPVEEKKVNEAKIDTEYLEIGPFYGVYATDGFGASGVYGLRLAYHLTEDVFFEGSFGMTQIDQSAFRRVTGRNLVSDEDLTYWNVDAAYNLFPGQIFLTRGRTLNSTLYLIGGLGQTTMDQQERFTFNVGTGIKVYLTDWLDIRVDFRVHAFETDITGEQEMNNNLEGTAALALFF
jgi:outer membrane beta-barrel protein